MAKNLRINYKYIRFLEFISNPNINKTCSNFISEKIIVFLMVTLLSTTLAHDVSTELQENGTQLETTAFRTLGIWGALNTGVGGIGALLDKDPERRAFHTMNAGWGAVNLGLALSGAASSRKSSTPESRAERWLRMPSVFALNAGLDALYISAGGWLWFDGRSNENPSHVGWGQSLILQGSALLLFDVWMALEFSTLNKKIWITSLPNGLAVQGSF
jgi:hypothetical protein